MRSTLFSSVLALSFLVMACTRTTDDEATAESAIDIEKSWAASLSAELSGAREQAKDLKDTRRAIADSADEIADSADEAAEEKATDRFIEAAGAHHQQIVDVTASLESKLKRMREKLAQPLLGRNVQNVANVAEAEFNAQLAALDELTRPDGLLDHLGTTSAMYVAAVSGTGRRKVALKTAVVTQIGDVVTKLDGVITVVDGWVLAATGTGSQGAEPPPVTPDVVETRILSGAFVGPTPFTFFNQASFDAAAVTAKERCRAWLDSVTLPAGATVRQKLCSTPAQTNSEGVVAAQVDATLKFEFSIPAVAKTKIVNVREASQVLTPFTFFNLASFEAASKQALDKCNARIALIKSLSKAAVSFSYCEPASKTTAEGRIAASVNSVIEFAPLYDASKSSKHEETVARPTPFTFFNDASWDAADKEALALCKTQHAEFLDGNPGTTSLVGRCIGPTKVVKNGLVAASYTLDILALNP